MGDAHHRVVDRTLRYGYLDLTGPQPVSIMYKGPAPNCRTAVLRECVPWCEGTAGRVSDSLLHSFSDSFPDNVRFGIPGLLCNFSVGCIRSLHPSIYWM